MIDVKRITDLEMYIDSKQAPKFEDAYFTFGTYQEDDGTLRDLTDAELDHLNDDSCFKYEETMKRIY